MSNFLLPTTIAESQKGSMGFKYLEGLKWDKYGSLWLRRAHYSIQFTLGTLYTQMLLIAFKTQWFRIFVALVWYGSRDESCQWSGKKLGMESKSRIWVWDETCDEICLDLGNFVRKTKTDLERYYRKSLANNKRTGFWIELVRSWMDRRCSRYWEAGIALEKMIEDTKPNFIYISITSTVYAIRQLNSLWNSNVRAYKWS